MDKTCSNCKHAIGFGPLHNKAIYAFCEKRSGVTKDKVLIVNRKNKCYAWEKRSDEDNEFLDNNFDKGALLANFSTLTADNGDDKYGAVKDYVTLIDCDQYRRYRKFMPKYDDWVWTLTPRSCTAGYAGGVRGIDPSGELSDFSAHSTSGVAPACLFNLNYLSSCWQAHIITHK